MLIKLIKSKLCPEFIRRRVSDYICRQSIVGQHPSVGKLYPTKPEYDPNEHKRYVTRLFRALYDDDCLNVALMGSFGCGKSSVLAEFKRMAEANGKAVATISFLSFKTTNAEGNITNILEREFLGQLLYQGNPANNPLSAFNNVHKKRFWSYCIPALIVTVLMMALLILVIFLADGVDRISNWMNYWKWAFSVDQLPTTLPVILIIFCIAYLISIFLLLELFRNKDIKSVSAGPASLSLEKHTSSYFNKYRDELIYFFEVNNIDTVIIEDLDRFNDLEIFEQLRNLNYLINRAPLVNRRVRFIYAVRDDLFIDFKPFDVSRPTSLPQQSQGEKCYSTSSADKTKLFDEIISVIPFLSEISSYDYCLKLFESTIVRISDILDKSRFDELLKISSPYLVDMRLLKCIYNDFIVMSEELELGLSNGRGELLGLTYTGLLSMVLYKAFYPSDYELARKGLGLLSDITEIHDASVSSRLKDLRAIRQTIQTFGLTDTTAVTDLYQSFGSALFESIGSYSRGEFEISLDGNSFSCNGSGPSIYSVDFWSAVLAAQDTAVLEITWTQYNGFSFRVPKAKFFDLFLASNEDGLNSTICIFQKNGTCLTDVEAEIEKCNNADFMDLPNLISQLPDGSRLVFEEYVHIKFGYGLAYDLITQGFLKKDYRLYISRYPANARASALNYMAHYYSKKSCAFDKVLSEDDCKEILRLVPRSRLSDPSNYNPDLMLFMLNSSEFRQEGINAITNAARVMGKDETLVLSRILERDVNRWNNTRFIKSLLSLNCQSFDFLISELEGRHAEDDVVGVVSRAFRCLNPDIVYECVRSAPWLASHIRFWDERLKQSGSACSAVEDVTLNAIEAFNTGQIVISRLQDIQIDCRAFYINLGWYKPNRTNIRLITGEAWLPSLDDMYYENITHGRLLFDAITKNHQSFFEYLNTLSEKRDEYSIKHFSVSFVSELSKSALNWHSNNTGDDLIELLLQKTSDKASVHSLRSFLGALYWETSRFVSLTFLDQLIANNKVEATLENCIYLADITNLSFDKMLELEKALLDKQVHPSDKLIIGLTKDTLAAFVSLLLLIDDSVSNRWTGIYELMLDRYPQLMPFDSMLLSVRLTDKPRLVVDLCARGILCLNMNAYNLLQQSGWQYRAGLLCLMDQMVEWDKIDLDLLPDDINRVINSNTFKRSSLRQYLITKYRTLD